MYELSLIYIYNIYAYICICNRHKLYCSISYFYFSCTPSNIQFLLNVHFLIDTMEFILFLIFLRYRENCQIYILFNISLK